MNLLLLKDSFQAFAGSHEEARLGAATYIDFLTLAARF